MRLCNNCLDSSDSVRAVPVGPDKGSQRDPYRETLDLCPLCRDALISGDLSSFHDFYCSERTIKQR